MDMEDVLSLIVITYAVSLSFGYLLQKYLRVPWMFAALFFGMILSPFGFFKYSIESESFQLLVNLAMLVILFIIGFNLDLKKISELKRHIFLGATFIISLEGIFGSFLLYFVFPDHVHNSLLIALITSFSFATVGEAVLLPILAEFNALDTTFGQLTLGIGTVDDILEVLILAVIVALPIFLPKAQIQDLPNPWLLFLTLGGMLFLTFVMTKNGEKIKKMLKSNSDTNGTNSISSLLILLVFFSFAALGGIVFEELATVGAILSGIVVRDISPRKMLKENEKEINFLGYALLSPLFFLNMGNEASLTSLLTYPLMIVLIWIVAKGSKLLASFLFFRKLLGNKTSLLLGLGLSVRFSTSLIVQFILLNSGYISLALYSALITTALLMKPVIIGIYSWGLANGSNQNGFVPAQKKSK